MSSVNFSELQSTTNASSGSQLFLRLDNGLSGADGFNRINFVNFEKSLNIYPIVSSFSANWNNASSVIENGGTVDGNLVVNGELSANFIRAASANIDVINITNYELSGFSILSGGLTVQGTISANNIIYDATGNSSKWNSVYSTVNTASAIWAGINTLSAAAWVDKSGSDVSGEIGNIHKPYLTMQAAFNDGAKIFYVGAGTFDGITASESIQISYMGVGQNLTTISTIQVNNTVSTAYTVSLQDIGCQTATIDTINSVGANSSDPTINAGDSGTITLINVKATYLNNIGGDGFNGTIDNLDGSDGGDSSIIYIKGNCYISSVSNYGGVGGNGYDDGINVGKGGRGGNSGGISGDFLYVTFDISSYGGAAGGNGSGVVDAVLGGAGGNITLRSLECAGTLNVDAGNGSGLIPPDIAAGNLTTSKANISVLNINPASAGDSGSINGQFIYIGILNGSPTINALISNINGTPYGT